MPQLITDLRTQSLQVWQRLSRVQKIALPAVGTAGAVALVALSLWARAPQYAPLYSSLSEQDAAAVVAKLQESSIPYSIGAAGSQILVPQSILYDVRLQMANGGLPTSSGTGFELFDQPSFGTTDFAQRVNYQRALEGELARTIERIEGVEQARIHLVLPQPSLYTEKQKEPTASVVISTKPGKRLLSPLVDGIANLVAGSVEGLKTESINIVDNAGNTLYEKVAPGDMASAQGRSSRMQLQRAFEASLESRLQGLLDAVLGPERAVVRVSASLDWDQVESTREIYAPLDSQPQPRSSQVLEEKYNAQGQAAGGIPGPGASVPSYQQSNTQNNGFYERKDATTNYELSRSVEKAIRAPGALQKLSIAVVMDGANAIDEAKLQQMRDALWAAAGMEQGRGDAISVSTLTFNRDAQERQERLLADAERRETILALAKTAILALAPLLLLVFLRFFLRRWGKRSQLVPQSSSMQALAEGEAVPLLDLVEDDIDIQLPRHEIVRRRVGNLARSQPDAVVEVIRAWLESDTTSKPR